MTSPLQQSPQHNEPLGKPNGTVRAYLAMSIVGTFEVAHLLGAGAMAYLGHVPEAMALTGALAVEAAAVLGYYFGTRSSGSTTHQYYVTDEGPPHGGTVDAIGFALPPSEEELDEGLRTRR